LRSLALDKSSQHRPLWSCAALVIVCFNLSNSLFGDSRKGAASTVDAAVAPRSLAIQEETVLTGIAEEGKSIETCVAECEACDDLRTRFLDNLSLFAGLDGSKGPQDLGINANFGFRTALNWAYPLVEEWGLGVQAGTAINYSRTAVSVLRSIGGPGDRTQSFTTVGLFERTNFGLKLGAGYDFLYEDYYNNFFLGQWRGLIGYDFGCDEIGLWATKNDRGDNGSILGVPLSLRPITQGNLYWRHTWSNEATTGFWVGLAESHGRFVLVIPGRPAIHHPFVFGSDLYVPLNDWVALFGEANFLTPNDSGTVDATLGFAVYPGGGAKRAARSRFSPLLPVANNPSFAVDLRSP